MKTTELNKYNEPKVILFEVTPKSLFCISNPGLANEDYTEGDDYLLF